MCFAEVLTDFGYFRGALTAVSLCICRLCVDCVCLSVRFFLFKWGSVKWVFAGRQCGDENVVAGVVRREGSGFCAKKVGFIVGSDCESGRKCGKRQVRRGGMWRE